MIRAIAEGKAAAQPETVMAMLQARIGRLDGGPGRAVRAAAVFGQTFWRSGVAAILDQAAASAEVQMWLTRLVDAELIVQHATGRFPAEPEYEFRHALVRDAAYGLLLPADLQLGHKRAGQYLIAKEDTDARAIAEHLERGGLLPEAGRAYLQAAEHSMKRADFQGTLTLLDCAIRCGAATQSLGLIRGLQAEAYFFTTDRARLAEVAEQAVGLLPPGTALWYKSLWRLIAVEIARGDAAAADRWVPVLVDSVPQPDARDAYVEALGVAISVLCTACRFALARILLLRSRELHRSFPPDAIQPGLLVAESQYLRTADPDPFRQYECLRLSLVYFHRIGHTEMVAILEDFIGESQGELGDHAGGQATLRVSLRRAEQAGQGYLIVHAQLHLAALLAGTADPTRWAEAERLVRQVLLSPQLTPTYREWSHGILARVLQRQGDAIQAEAEARRALQLPATAPLRRLLVTATLIDTLLAQGRLGEARDAAQAALGELAQLGSGGYAEVTIRLAAADALTACADPGATEQLQRARREVLRRAAKIPDPALRARYLTQIPDNARLFPSGAGDEALQE